MPGVTMQGTSFLFLKIKATDACETHQSVMFLKWFKKKSMTNAIPTFVFKTQTSLYAMSVKAIEIRNAKSTGADLKLIAVKQKAQHEHKISTSKYARTRSRKSIWN